MKIEFDENGKFELEIYGSAKLVFAKRDDGCIAVTMPKFYNETTQQLSQGLVNNVLVIAGTKEQFDEQLEKQNPS